MEESRKKKALDKLFSTECAKCKMEYIRRDDDGFIASVFYPKCGDEVCDEMKSVVIENL